MSKLLVVMGFALTSAGVLAQSDIIASTKERVQTTVVQTMTPQTYTQQQMKKMGLSEADITLYRTQRETIKGSWWGHVSPVEFLMYAAEDKNERDRYAKLYLSSNLPKAAAERDAMVSMFEMAREVFAEEHGLAVDNSPTEKRPALFVDIRCAHCNASVVELINRSTMKVDVYFTGLPVSEDPVVHQDAMVAWAKALNLKPEQITLNNDNGIYEKLNNTQLVDYHLMTQ